jgi:hypothetical protein
LGALGSYGARLDSTEHARSVLYTRSMTLAGDTVPAAGYREVKQAFDAMRERDGVQVALRVATP